MPVANRAGNEWAEFQAGPVRLALHGTEERSVPASGTVVFRVDDLDEARWALQQRGVVFDGHESEVAGVRPIHHVPRPRRQPRAADRISALTRCRGLRRAPARGLALESRMVATAPGTWQAVPAGPPTFPRAGGVQSMTETARHFPGSTRAAVVAALLVLVSVAATAAGAAPPSKEDVAAREASARGDRGRARRASRSQLAATQLQLNAAAAEVEQQEIALEKVTTDLVRTAGAARSSAGALRARSGLGSTSVPSRRT